MANSQSAGWRRFRSKVLVEARQVDHDGHAYDPRTGAKEEFRSGDYLVRQAGGKLRVEPHEKFDTEYEAVD